MGPLTLALALALAQDPAPELRPGAWDACLDSPGGDLRFILDLPADRPRGAFLVNGEERIEVPEVRLEDGGLVLEMPHYDSRIRALSSGEGARLDGEWTRVGSGGKETRLGFHAAWLGSEGRRPERTGGAPTALAGRWAVDFEKSDDPAVAIFSGTEPSRDRDLGEIRGTFLTTLGDYRFLAGTTDARTFELSCFDGAHAFLFKGELVPGDVIEGDFWSRDTWHEKWTAVRDPDARLPDPFGLTRWNEDASLAEVAFPDLDGVVRSLDDPAFRGGARILKLFGTWCPNCNDEAPYLAELDRRYRARGLRIVGLAFEHTGDFERDARQCRRYAERHGIEFPILLAGTSDKQEASRRFPLLDRVRAFPTTVFLHGDGRVRAVHTGFAGPATGAEHQKLREDFERLIEELLAEDR